MPQKQGSLTQQHNFWRLVFKHQTLRCLYSKSVVNKDDFSLDYYLPWSFVVHDQLWNLIPVLPSVNSSKSNNVPDGLYFKHFVDIQHLGLLINHEEYPRQWEKSIEPYVIDLGIPKKDLLDRTILHNAYESTIKPLFR